MRLDRILIILALVVLAGAALLFGVKNFGRERAPKPPPVATGEVSLMVVGIEGLELSIVERLIAEGRLPNIARLMRDGATGEFANLGRLTDRQISWTSLVTGVSPANQGIGGKIVSHRGDVVDAPLTPEYRTVGTLWTMLSDSGSGVAVLSWPGTWPVEEVNGVMIGSYEHYYLEREHGGDPREAIYPLVRHAELDPLIIGRGTNHRKDLTGFVNVDTRLGLEALIGKSYETLDLAVAGDRSMLALTRHLAADPSVESVFVLLGGLENVSQRFWHYADPDVIEWQRLDDDTRELLHGQVDALGGTLDRYYEFVDEIVGELLELVGEDGLFAIVTDHGYSGLEVTEEGHLKIGQHMHSDEGFWVIRGPGIARGARVDGRSLLDFAPTVMRAAGMDIPGEVEGAVCEEALAP
jgi:predicted AlkP superfamily phosphohydrolase/phosphomutase